MSESWIRKLTKKSRGPDKHPKALGSPSHIDPVSPDTGGKPDTVVGPEGANDGQGTRIVISASGHRRSHESGTPTTRIRKEDVPLPRERGSKQEVSPDIQIEQLSRNTPRLYSIQKESEDLNRRGRNEQETVAEGPTEMRPEDLFGDYIGEDARIVWPWKSTRVVENNGEDEAIWSAIIPDKATKLGFGSLKAVLSTIYTNHKGIVAVGNKAEDLLSRVDELERYLDSRPRNEAELNRRNGVIQMFDEIDRRLRLSEEPEAQQSILDDLQEIIFDYKTIQQRAAYEHGCSLIDPAELTFLNSFCSAQGAEYIHGNHKGCLKGTRGTILDGIGLWTRDFYGSPVYWLNGLAGTGKTTIAQTVAERTFADGRLGASFFCSRNFEDRSNLQLIFPTLAVQLARRYPEFRSTFIPLVKSDPGVIHQSLHNQMDKLIVRPLTESAISTVIVIDALDECKDRESTSAILSVLGRLTAEVHKVKFFLTGRPEPRIQTGFRLPLLKDVTDVFVLHEVKPNLVANDIQSFFKHSFLEIASCRGGLDGWPTDEEVERLCERAAGLFVYAVATVKFIDKRATSPRKQLDLLLRSPESSTREAKTEWETNATLDLLYTSILHEAFGEKSDPDNDPKVRSVLGAMLFTANPVSPSTIASLLELDYDEVFPILSSAQSLLILQDINCPVKPFHKSFPDFITDRDRCTDQRFHLTPPYHHSQLLIGCLDLMGRTLEKNMCKLPAGVANSDVNDLKDRVERYINPALQYACRSWHTHLVGGRVSINKLKITSALHKFLEGKFLFWLEVLSALGAVRNAVDALQAAVDWLEESPTFDLADDCSRFVTGHFDVISASSPHIYHSALMLTPAESIIWRLYKSHAQPFSRVVHGVPALWDPIAAATTTPFQIDGVLWSPCSRFIAIFSLATIQVDILEPTILQRLHRLEFPLDTYLWFKGYAFSLDSRTLTSFVYGHDPDYAGFVVSWDIQTGGVVSAIEWKGDQHTVIKSIEGITHSINGRMVAILFNYESFSTISIYDIVSGVFVGNIDHHALDLGTPHVEQIWTHGESLQFATCRLTATTIWEVEFAMGTTPTKVETLFLPNDTVGAFAFEPMEENDTIQTKLHPTSCRLALVRIGTIHGLLVWDAQISTFLLHCTDVSAHHHMTFSSDGCSFAYQNIEFQICLWKESSNGYTLFKKLKPSSQSYKSLLSPSFESIVTTRDFGCKVHLQHIRSFTTTPSSILPQACQNSDNEIILEFHPDMSLAVATRKGAKIVVVFDLKSNVLQLTIDTSIEVYGLRLIENSVVVIGIEKAITWELPGENFLPGTSVNLEDSTQTINLPVDLNNEILSVASISLDLKYVALGYFSRENRDKGMKVYCTSTEQTMCVTIWVGALWFVPGEQNIWCVMGGGAKVFTIGHNTLDHTKTIPDIEDGSWGSPWGSSCGYTVTEDGWIVGMKGRRLLMLPPLWQSYKSCRVWNGKFLALLHDELPDIVILELEP